MPNKHSRRSAIKNIIAGTAALGTATMLPSYSFSETKTQKQSALKGNINHSVCQWTYSFLSLDELCKAVKEIGFNAIDLLVDKDGLRFRNTEFILPCVIMAEKLV